MKNLTIVHASVVHSPYDDRIFFRQAQTLSNYYCKIHIIGFADEASRTQSSNSRVSIIEIRKQKLKKMSLQAYRLFSKIKPNIVHIHDPYLIPWACRYKAKNNIQIIYDIHENWSLLALASYSNKFLQTFLRAFYIYCIEKYYLNRFSGIVVADDDLYIKYCHYRNIIQIRNYATSGNKITNSTEHQKLISQIIDFKKNCRLLIYVGHVDSARALDVPIKAVAECAKNLNLKIKFLIIGPGESQYINQIQALSKQYGQSTLIIKPVLYNQIYDILSLADYGWAVIPDNFNFKHRIPNKIFDYMRSGLMIVGSNLTFTKSLIKKHPVGHIVNPVSVNNSVCALKKLLKEPPPAQMSSQIKQIFQESYHWNKEAPRLIAFYENIIK